MIPHYAAMVVGYAVALTGWVVVASLPPVRKPGPTRLWPPPARHDFARPWVDLGLAFVAVAGVIGVGRLWSMGWLIPERGVARPLLAAANQILIFSPLLTLLAVRRQGLRTAWLPGTRVWLRLAIGAGLAALAAAAYWSLRSDQVPSPRALAFIVDPANLDKLVQVLLEDVAIAIVLVRLAATLRSPAAAVAIVGVLFAAAHVPAMLATGASGPEYARLLLDAGLAIAALSVVQRSQDVWWFWLVHYTMDMTQFVDRGGIG